LIRFRLCVREMSLRHWQIILFSLRRLWRYRLRSTLLALSAAIGVGGVVCSVNYGAGGTEQILEQIRRMGTNVLIITPAQSRVIAGRARTGQAVTTLVERDDLAIRREVFTRARSSALVSASFWLKAGDLSKNAAVVGCEPDYFLIRNWPMAEGSVLEAAQERAASRVALLGHTVAKDLFGAASPIGNRLLINRVPFTVIGVLTERGQGLDVANEDEQVYVPLSTAMRRLMNVDYYSGLIIEVDSMNEMDAAVAQIRPLLHQLHHIQPKSQDDFQIQSQKTLLDTQLAAANRLGFFLRWIEASALVVSGLGMLGITWIAVKERTREFGTRRALGATASDVFLQVISENAVLALVGCVAGGSASWPISRYISRAAGVTFVFDTNAVLIAFAAAAVMNIGFAIWPSRAAATLDPISALRYE
jgi:putative ABC transport system permease protein